ncbi:MAG: hypothetical protein LBD58_05225 [Treponema sp.]|jgi:hypothetical protein|nr:hypothetical protein [Treponema sp.]
MEYVIETDKRIGLLIKSGCLDMNDGDFSLYQEKNPAVVFTIDVGSLQMIHHPGFIADPSQASAASEFLATLGAVALERLAQ